jgi:hypothetical protein
LGDSLKFRVGRERSGFAAPPQLHHDSKANADGHTCADSSTAHDANAAKPADNNINSDTYTDSPSGAG